MVTTRSLIDPEQGVIDPKDDFLRVQAHFAVGVVPTTRGTGSVVEVSPETVELLARHLD